MFSNKNKSAAGFWTRPFALLLLCAPFAGAGTLSFTGFLSDPNAVVAVPITLTATADLIVQTYGYGGGINGQGTTISSGGFQPSLTIFSGTGPGATYLDANNIAVACPPADVDPNTAACFDEQLFETSLPAGQYLVALSTFDNPSGSDPNTTFGTAFGSTSTGFSDLLGDSRTANYAFDISSSALEIPVSELPEPGTLASLGLSFAALGTLVRFRSR